MKNRWTLIVCDKCKQPGGTLRKASDGVYRHDRCPEVKKGQRVEVPNVKIPTLQEIEKFRRKVS
uniref:Uncharacterized protein n=1 Tax=viral metagenome TaxID=1070528 RepID=A0A6M3J785_9ZZZZ